MPLNTSKAIKPKDTTLFYIFLALIIWLPLPLGSNRPWAWHLMEVMSYSLVAVWGYHYIQQKVELPVVFSKNNWLITGLLTFAAIILLQIIPFPASLIELLRPVNKSVEPGNWITLSIDPVISWLHIKQTLAYTCLAFLTLALINTRKRLKVLALVFVISGALQALYGSLMTLSGIEFGFFFKKEAFHGVATGTFWNRNHLANYLILCLAMGTGLLLSELYQTQSTTWRERSRRILASLLGNKARVRISLAIMVIALVLTHSRMGNTAFFFSLIASGIIWLAATKRFTRGSIALIISLIVIDTMIVGAWFGIDKVAERLEGTAFNKETRDEVNRDTLTLIQDQPLFGTGAGSFYTAFPQYRQADITLYYDHAHNDYLQFVAEHGLIGVIPLISIVIAALVLSVQTMRKRKTLQMQAMAFAPLMSIIAMLLHSTVDFSLQLPANAASFVIVLSLAWVVRYMPRSAKA
ncbi:O-antigen ligase family protein [Litoribacillus peritrichatus]|uniref:O-antigen ligase n=1 Tax=Litoribacillus peritrichatus TaxID=718191 RepID=A0ABP7M596_9GAMM